jgi:hypothetical protein
MKKGTNDGWWLLLLPVFRSAYAVLGGTLLWLVLPDIAWWRVAVGAVGASFVIAGGVTSGVDGADVYRWRIPVRDGVREAAKDA